MAANSLIAKRSGAGSPLFHSLGDEMVPLFVLFGKSLCVSLF